MKHVRYPAVYWVACICERARGPKPDGVRKYLFDDFCTVIGCGTAAEALDALAGAASAHKGPVMVMTGRMGEDGDQDGAVMIPIVTMTPPGRIEVHPWPRASDIIPEYAIFVGRVLSTLVTGGARPDGRILTPR